MKNSHAFLVSHLHAISSHHPLPDHPNNIWRAVQILKLFITQFSPVSMFSLPQHVLLPYAGHLILYLGLYNPVSHNCHCYVHTFSVASTYWIWLSCNLCPGQRKCCVTTHCTLTCMAITERQSSHRPSTTGGGKRTECSTSWRLHATTQVCLLNIEPSSSVFILLLHILSFL